MSVEYFSGRVHSVIFDNAAEDFYIARVVLDSTSDSYAPVGEMFTLDDPNRIVMRGNVPGMKLEVGSWIGFEGKWVNHAQYGRQVQVLKAPVIRTWSSEVATTLLSSNGVGPRVCKALEAIGRELVDTLNAGDEARLVAQCEGVSAFQAAHVVTTWKNIRAYYQTIGFLNQLGINKKALSRIWSHFGDDAEEVLSKNPWRMVEIEGITFPQADEAARRLGLDMSSSLRLIGAVLYTAKSGRGMGHMYLSMGDLLAQVQAYVADAGARDVATALSHCHKAGTLVIDRQTRPGTTAIYEPWFYELEKESARLLRERVDIAAIEDPEHVAEYARALASVGPRAEEVAEQDPNDMARIARAALDDWGNTSHMSLSEHQLQGALNALTEPVSILTGLPGTGKTTTLLSVVRTLQNAGVRFLLVAPTGIAAKRMSSVAGAEASTIHRAFGAKGKDEDDGREATYTGIVGESSGKVASDSSAEMWDGQNNPSHADVVICDEASMVDQHLLYRILTCTKPTARLVFVGDAAQLPSVGPGNVLRELISSGLFPTVSLTEIYRQGDTSQIVTAAHAINAGEIPTTGRSTKDDFLLLPRQSEDENLDVVLKIADTLFRKRRNFQVISPRHAGTLGVTNLNSRLRELLNPQSPGLQEIRLGRETLREGDRVMVIKNDYELGIFNGDVGKVSKINRRDQEVEIKIHGPPIMNVCIPFKKAPERLRLAYGMTVHKCQGQEYDVIVLPVVKSFSHQLQRNLLYTAITRAKQKVIMVGHHEAFVRAILNSRTDDRNTLFQDRLRIAFAEAA